MADNLTCGETSDSWIIDNEEKVTSLDTGFITNETDCDYPNNELLSSKVDNFKSNRSFLMMGSLTEDIIREMVEKEIEFMPGIDYVKRLRSGDLESRVRNQALGWILKVCGHYHFGPLCIYLSINYLDRFLTSYELPKDKAWAVQLLAVSCLSLAVKMEETDMPQSVDLQVEDPTFVFEAKTIKRMELLILNTLNWRMQALTPFSFVDYFIYKFTGHVTEDSIFRSSQFILNTIKATEFLDFRPSEIAAAAALGVCIDAKKGMSNLLYVNQERVKRCFDLMRNVKEENVMGDRLLQQQQSLAVPESPNGVLEVTCLSYKSEERTVESCTNSSQSSPDNYNTSNKRRRKQ